MTWVSRVTFFALLLFWPCLRSGKAVSFDGPLVPYIADQYTLLLYEATLDGDPNGTSSTYLPPENTIGKKLICFDSQEPCELYVRHLKKIPQELLPGFRTLLYCSVIRSLTMDPLNCQSEVNITGGSNSARVRLVNCSRDLTEEDIGSTLYLPSDFSILLQGPSFNLGIFHGLTTLYSRSDLRVTSKETFLLNLGTESYRKRRRELMVEEIERERDEKQKKREEEFDLFKKVIECQKNRGNEESCHISQFKSKPKSRVLKQRDNATEPEPSKPRNSSSWTIEEGGCHFRVELEQNPLLSGPKRSFKLDLHDAISLSIIVRPISKVGLIMLYRHVFLVSSSNTSVFKIKESYTEERTLQILKVTVSPSGITGSSQINIRSVVNSNECKDPLHFQYNLSATRAPERYLSVTYPIPVCVTQINASKVCISLKELDKPGEDVKRDGKVVFRALEVNYRPPSDRGDVVPTSSHVYNVDPSRPIAFRDQPLISKESYRLKQCQGSKSREECACSGQDRSENVDNSDCIHKVYQVERAVVIPIKLSYEPLFDPKYQHPEFFTPNTDLFVQIEEVNGRKEYTLESKEPSKLKEINRNSKGNIFFDGKTLKVTPYGRGLYHFKATLGPFASFDPPSGYFIFYVHDSNYHDIMTLNIVMLTLVVVILWLLAFFYIKKSFFTSMIPEPMYAKSKTV